MKRVLHYVAVMDRGGQETLIMNLFRNINRNEFKFDFLCTLEKKGEYDDEIESLGGNIYHINNGSSRIKLVDRSINLKNFMNEHRGEFDVFHIHTQHSMDAYLNAKIAISAGVEKVFVHSHNCSSDYHPILHKIFKPLLKTLNVKRLACTTDAGKWLFGENEKVEVIKNGIITKNFSFSDSTRKKVREQQGWNDKYVIGHVGRFTYQKNQEYVIDVFNEYHKNNPNSILVFIGNGEDIKTCKRRVDELRLTQVVLFMDVRSDVNEMYQGFDLFLFPSRYEGLGIVIIEAQCTGLQCLISDTIPNDVDLTDLVERMNINEKPECWVNKIDILRKNNKDREIYCELIASQGYDIKESSKKICSIYMSK